MWEGTTSRVTVPDRSYGEFYEFYSFCLQKFGYHLVYSPTCDTCKQTYIGQTNRTIKLRYQVHTRYIKNDPQSASAQHILYNRHEYGPIDKTTTLLKPLSNTSLLTAYKQYYIHSLHKEGKLISEQSPGDPNPLLLLAIDPSQPLT